MMNQIPVIRIGVGEKFLLNDVCITTHLERKDRQSKMRSKEFVNPTISGYEESTGPRFLSSKQTTTNKTSKTQTLKKPYRQRPTGNRTDKPPARKLLIIKKSHQTCHQRPVGLQQDWFTEYERKTHLTKQNKEPHYQHRQLYPKAGSTQHNTS